MDNIKPVKRILLVELIKENDPERNGIILPRANRTNFDVAKVLEVGPEVADFKKGDVIYVHYSRTEEIEIGSRKGFISEADCFAKIEGYSGKAKN